MVSLKNNKNHRLIGWALLVGIALFIKVLSYFPDIVEKYYTFGFYPFISGMLRRITGWAPFSFGDLLYSVALVVGIRWLLKIIKTVKNKKITFSLVKKQFRKIVFVGISVYVIFYSFWGLNYSRTGISQRLQLREDSYSVQDLDTLVQILHTRLNNNAAQLTPAIRDSFRLHKNLFQGAVTAYKVSEKEFPFLSYSVKSVKPSLFSYLGNYLGFQGYYNPFSGEAQVNTTIPQSVEPFVSTHELAHQLGYAKESEANFVGFLACRRHPSVNFKYSVYFDMYHYGIRELFARDSSKAEFYETRLHPAVKKDVEAYIAFYKKYKNPLEPIISWVYNHFLIVNNQPKGNASYNDVVTWLIAYYKKYGQDAI